MIVLGYKSTRAPEGESFCGITYDISIAPSKNSKTVKGKINLKIRGTRDQIDTPFQG